MTETKVTKDDVLKTLRTYVQQQIDCEAIDIIEMVVNELDAKPSARPRLVLGTSPPFDTVYAEILKHADAFELGDIKPPGWLLRVRNVLKEIRDEFDLHNPPDTPNAIGKIWTCGECEAIGFTGNSIPHAPGCCRGNVSIRPIEYVAP